MRLDVGCGDKVLEGHVGCDIRPEEGVEVVCAAWEVDQHVQDLEGIASRHMLEHLTYPEAMATLRSWFRALMPGGELQICVPNLLHHMKQMIEATFTDEEIGSWKSNTRCGMAGLYGWQRHEHDIHKSGWVPILLYRALLETGFEDIEVGVWKKKHLWAKAIKPTVYKEVGASHMDRIGEEIFEGVDAGD